MFPASMRGVSTSEYKAAGLPEGAGRGGICALRGTSGSLCSQLYIMTKLVKRVGVARRKMEVPSKLVIPSPTWMGS